MGISDIIRTLCKENGTTINKLEQELGIGRGNIARWDAHKPSYDKLKAVADHFGVTTDYLLSGGTKNNTPTSEGERSTSTEQQLKVLARHLDSIPEDARQKLINNFSDSIDLYLDAMGVPREG